MNVLVIGKPKYNVYLQTEEYPKEGSIIKVPEKLEMTGGTSVYVACMLAKWGMQVSYAGAVSGDEIGNKIKAEIESYGVDIKHMETDFERKTNYNFIVLNKANGSSTQIEHTNETALKKYRYEFIPDFIITDGSDMGASMAAANNYPTAKIITLANKLDVEYANLSKRSAYVCASLRFAAALVKVPVDYRSKALVNLFQKVRDLNKAEFIMMMQEKGVLYRKERQVKMIPAIEVQKQDDGNSGSAFFAAYCYGIINGYDMDEVAKIANIAGALSLTKVGTLSSIPTKEEVYKMSGLTEGEKKSETPAQPAPVQKTAEMPAPNVSQTAPTAEMPAPAAQGPAAPTEMPAPSTPEVVQTPNIDAALQNIAGQPSEMPKPINNEGTTNETL